ncbi:hypothetical protein GOV11_04715 [Candidatus Woesearchaeota archaeon]|nr:hypothetical protein [Candidatus Woesearchaeota archaeon]
MMEDIYAVFKKIRRSDEFGEYAHTEDKLIAYASGKSEDVINFYKTKKKGNIFLKEINVSIINSNEVAERELLEEKVNNYRSMYKKEVKE